MKTKWIAGTMVVVIGSAATVYALQKGKRGGTEGEIIPIKRGRIQVSVQEVGSVEPLRKVEIKSKVAGQVQEVRVDVGDRVKAGDVLMRLDPLDAARDQREV